MGHGRSGEGDEADERDHRRHAGTHADQSSGSWANSLRPAGSRSRSDHRRRVDERGHLARPDRRRPEPLWHQVEQSVSAAIDGGSWKSGARIPGEDELTKVLGVSRITVRHALSNLQSAGVLRRRAWPRHLRPFCPAVADTRALMSFSREMAALGLDTGTPRPRRQLGHSEWPGRPRFGGRGDHRGRPRSAVAIRRRSGDRCPNSPSPRRPRSTVSPA